MADPGDAGRSIAFFDLDGTLIVGQTQLLLVLFLRAQRVVRLAFLLGTGLWFAAYKARLVRVTQEARARGARVLAGLTEAEVAGLMSRFAEEVMTPRLHAQAVAALRRHQEHGDRVVVISAALEPVVKALCDRLGVADYVGASCQIREGRYTGDLDGPTPYGEEKARVAKSLAERLEVDPADCWAYADHETDLRLLQSVGHPVAVNPRPGLLKAALEGGWLVLP